MLENLTLWLALWPVDGYHDIRLLAPRTGVPVGQEGLLSLTLTKGSTEESECRDGELYSREQTQCALGCAQLFRCDLCLGRWVANAVRNSCSCRSAQQRADNQTLAVQNSFEVAILFFCFFSTRFWGLNITSFSFASAVPLRVVRPTTVLPHKCDIPSLLKDDQIVHDNRLPVHCRRLWSLEHHIVIPVATQRLLPPVCLPPSCING